MNLSAILFIVVFWGALILLTFWCFYKMLKAPAMGIEDEPEVPFTP